MNYPHTQPDRHNRCHTSRHSRQHPSSVSQPVSHNIQLTSQLQRSVRQTVTMFNSMCPQIDFTGLLPELDWLLHVHAPTVGLHPTLLPAAAALPLPPSPPQPSVSPPSHSLLPAKSPSCDCSRIMRPINTELFHTQHS